MTAFIKSTGEGGFVYLRATARVFKAGVINTTHSVWNTQDRCN